MSLTQGGGHYCENCDSVQPQERLGIARRKTAQDIRFEMGWLRTINKEYADNTPQADRKEGDSDG